MLRPLPSRKGWRRSFRRTSRPPCRTSPAGLDRWRQAPPPDKARVQSESRPWRYSTNTHAPGKVVNVLEKISMNSATANDYRFQLVSQASARKAQGPAPSVTRFPRAPIRHRCLCPTCYQEPYVFPVAWVARLPQQSTAATTRHALDSLPFDPALRKTSIPIPGLPFCTLALLLLDCIFVSEGAGAFYPESG